MNSGIVKIYFTILLLLTVLACTGSPRSEVWMRSHFAKHRADFDKLVELSNEDFAKSQVIRIADEFTRLANDWSWPRPEDKWGITSDRWLQYRKLFQTLKLPAGLNRDGKNFGYVLLMTYGVGLAGEGTEYGYLWSPNNPVQVNNKKEYFATKPLEGKWYLYEWRVY